MTAPPPPGPPFEVRTDQLSELSTICRRLAAVLMIRGEVSAARLYAARAVRAEELLAHGFAQADLDVVGADFPAEPAWLGRPGSREPWQDEVARVHGLACGAAAALLA